MFEQNLLDLRARNVVAGTDDHVVNARMIPKEAVFVGVKGVAGNVPALNHVGFLPLYVVQITAPDRTANRQLADSTRRNRFHVVVNHRHGITWKRLPGGAGPDVVAWNSDEGVQQ